MKEIDSPLIKQVCSKIVPSQGSFFISIIFLKRVILDYVASVIIGANLEHSKQIQKI